MRYPYRNGDLTANGKPEKIVERIPWVHHWTRDIAFSADDQRLLLSVGSGSNVALDMFPEPLVKGGLQAWIKTQPLGATWDTEERRADLPLLRSGRQERGDNTPFEYATQVKEGAFYGWPWYYIGAGSTPRPESWATSSWPQTASRFAAWRTSPSRSSGSAWAKPSSSRSGTAEARHRKRLKSPTWKYGRPLLALEIL